MLQNVTNYYENVRKFNVLPIIKKILESGTKARSTGFPRVLGTQHVALYRNAAALLIDGVAVRFDIAPEEKPSMLRMQAPDEHVTNYYENVRKCY